MAINIKYLANTAFLIKNAKHSMLIDSFYQIYDLPYSDIPEDVYKEILEKKGDFSDIDIVLVTHYHQDHCTKARLSEYENRNAVLILPQDTSGGSEDDVFEKHIAVPENGGRLMEDESIAITAIPTRHDGDDKIGDTVHFSYFAEFITEGINILFLGDADTDDETMDAVSGAVNGKKIDCLVLNFVKINQEKGRRFIKAIDAKMTLLCHLPLPEDDRYHMAKLAKRNLARLGPEFDTCVMCDESGMSFEID